MKSIFQFKIYEYFYKIENYLSIDYIKDVYLIGTDIKHERVLPIHTLKDNELMVCKYSLFKEIIDYYETDKYNCRFKEKDKICIDDEIYEIISCVYGEDKNTYIIKGKDNIIIDNNKEKEEIIKTYEEMKEKENIKVIKWWQFWKQINNFINKEDS